MVSSFQALYDERLRPEAGSQWGGRDGEADHVDEKAEKVSLRERMKQ